ncbi:hypothetical protein RI367_000126 [Sorochytrium milnesiophthora]
MADPFVSVPLELLLHIALYLRLQDVLALSVCNRSLFQRCLQSRDLWVSFLYSPRTDSIRFLLLPCIQQPLLQRPAFNSAAFARVLLREVVSLDKIDLTPPIAPLRSPHLLSSLPLLPLCASSTDNEQQSIHVTIRDTDSLFWSSKGSADPLNSDEWLVYEIDSHSEGLGALLSGVEITPYRAYFQRNAPCYAPLQISVQVGVAAAWRRRKGAQTAPQYVQQYTVDHLPEEADSSGDIVWYYASPRWQVTNNDEPQVFSFAPTLLYATHVRIRLHGKQGVQTIDNQFYSVLSLVRVFGVHSASLPDMQLHTLYECILMFHSTLASYTSDAEYTVDVPQNALLENATRSAAHQRAVRLYTMRLNALRKITAAMSLSLDEEHAAIQATSENSVVQENESLLRTLTLTHEESDALRMSPDVTTYIHTHWPMLFFRFTGHLIVSGQDLHPWEVECFRQLMESQYTRAEDAMHSTYDRHQSPLLALFLRSVLRGDFGGTRPSLSQSPLFAYAYNVGNGPVSSAQPNDPSLQQSWNRYYEVTINLAIESHNLAHAYASSICSKYYLTTAQIGFLEWRMSVFEIARDVARFHKEQWQQLQVDHLPPNMPAAYGSGVKLLPAHRGSSRGDQVAEFAIVLLHTARNVGTDHFMTPTPVIDRSSHSSSVIGSPTAIAEPLLDRLCQVCNLTQADALSCYDRLPSNERTRLDTFDLSATSTTLAVPIATRSLVFELLRMNSYAQHAAPPGVDPTLWAWFKAADTDNSGSITGDELQRILYNNASTPFNDETIRLMINMFDRDHSASLQFHEFAQLWKYINEWRACFQGFDRDGSGSIDRNELKQALLAFGYNISDRLVAMLIRKYDRHGQGDITFDSFIQTCVTVRALTESFQRYDTDKDGYVNVSYETFLELVLANR